MPSATRRIQLVGQSPHSNGVARPFLIELLSLQCQCGGAERAVVIQPDGTGSVRVLASYPYSGDGHETPEWFQNCVELGLVDEAVTPLIISGPAPNPEQTQAFCHAARVAADLTSPEDYSIDPRYREVELTDRGRSRLAALTASLPGIWQGARRREELVTKALVARDLYLRDKQYVISDGKVVIVDDFTGRVMPDRSWRDGLHQAIEAKENLEVTAWKDTYARVSFQRFFRQYEHLAGMTGTAQEAASEFWQIYNLPVVVIPTNRPCVRKVLPDLVFVHGKAKWQCRMALP